MSRPWLPAFESGWKNIFIDFSLDIDYISTRSSTARIFVRESVTDFSVSFGENSQNCIPGFCAEIGERVSFEIQFLVLPL